VRVHAIDIIWASEQLKIDESEERVELQAVQVNSRLGLLDLVLTTIESRISVLILARRQNLD
jgi:hypothetical protein